MSQTPEVPENENLPVKPEPAQTPVFQERRGMWSRGPADTSGYNQMVRTLRMPGTSQQPFSPAADAIWDRARQLVPGLADATALFDRGQLGIYVPRELLPEVVKVFRDDPQLRFEICMSVCGAHFPEQTGSELQVAYELLSMTHNRRVRLLVLLDENDPHVPSVVPTYPMADWHERETWDFFGVIFDGHPHLTRILMPDDWVGHPQRKDYPLGGIDVEYKGARVPAPDNRRTYS